MELKLVFYILSQLPTDFGSKTLEIWPKNEFLIFQKLTVTKIYSSCSKDFGVVSLIRVVLVQTYKKSSKFS